MSDLVITVTQAPVVQVLSEDGNTLVISNVNGQAGGSVVISDIGLQGPAGGIGEMPDAIDGGNF